MFHKRLFLAAACVGAAVATSAQAHARLQSSDPVAGSVLASAPKEIRLKFNEALEPAFSNIKLTDDKNAELKLPRAQVGTNDPTIMTAALPRLGRGTYHVVWTTMTRDSHKTKGEFSFQVE
jgi:hypothetical protein